MKRYVPIVMLLAATSLFGQHLSQTVEGPVYNSRNQIIAYRYADGTVDTYRYDSAGQLMGSTHPPGKVSSSTPSAEVTQGHRHKKRRPIATPIDASLYTDYVLYFNDTSVSWAVCGSVGQIGGCFSSGSLGLFGKIGALLESKRSIDTTTKTVARNIYVLDVASGDTANGVTLFVYNRTDSIKLTAGTESTDVSLLRSIDLPLTGGAAAIASMAANDKVLVIGTNQTSNAVVLQKSDFSFTKVGGFSPPLNVAGITTDPYGYINITYGTFNGSNTGFIGLDPNGEEIQVGGPADFLLNTDQAVLPPSLP